MCTTHTTRTYAEHSYQLPSHTYTRLHSFEMNITHRSRLQISKSRTHNSAACSFIKSLSQVSLSRINQVKRKREESKTLRLNPARNSIKASGRPWSSAILFSRQCGFSWLPSPSSRAILVKYKLKISDSDRRACINYSAKSQLAKISGKLYAGFFTGDAVHLV